MYVKNIFSSNPWELLSVSVKILHCQILLNICAYLDLIVHSGKLKINSCSPGEKMSGLKRMSKHMLLMDPTALQAFKTTSRLFGSVCE